MFLENLHIFLALLRGETSFEKFPTTATTLAADWKAKSAEYQEIDALNRR
jgi:hypothetical protein